MVLSTKIVLLGLSIFKNFIKSIFEKIFFKTDKKSAETVDSLLSKYKPDPFVPYVYYNKHLDSLQVYFKDHNFYSKTLNENIDLYVSQKTSEVVGIHVFNISEIVL